MLRLIVESVFHIEGHGIIVAGRIQEGGLKVGDPVDVCSPTKTAVAVVAALEKISTRELIPSAKAGDDVGVLFRNLSLDCVADGVQKVEPFGWGVLSLEVRGKPRKWWQFW